MPAVPPQREAKPFTMAVPCEAVPFADTISAVRFSPANPHLLAAGCWDKRLRLFALERPGGALAPGEAPQAVIRRVSAPILSLSFVPMPQPVMNLGLLSGEVAQVMARPDGTTEGRVIGRHPAAVTSTVCIDDNVVLTGSWDETVRLWDAREKDAGEGHALMECGSNVVGLDAHAASYTVLAAAGGMGRKVKMMDMRKPGDIRRHLTSPLRFPTRCVKLFPGGDGYIVGSIEGRCGVRVDSLREEGGGGSFCFKCHRHGPRGGPEHIYAVNDIAFHPATPESFATVGGDGQWVWWHKADRKRLCAGDHFAQSLTSCDFSPDGNRFAFACSYDYTKGVEGAAHARRSHVFVTPVSPADIRSRGNANRGNRRGRR